jgi:transcriptional regulator with XRE-family HTH domain
MSMSSSTNESHQYHQRVGKLRERFALSQTEMAERVGLSLRAYQNYERGEREVPVALVRALYAEFRVNPVWLLTGSGSMIMSEEQPMRLDQKLLDRVVDAVEKFETGLDQALSVEHKSRLIGLLYEKSQLLSEVAGEKLSPAKMRSLLKLVA